jgi:surfactin synthase thioesterase subunit
LGHSLGAWVAYEVARELARHDGAPQPSAVFVSANRCARRLRRTRSPGARRDVRLRRSVCDIPRLPFVKEGSAFAPLGLARARRKLARHVVCARPSARRPKAAIGARFRRRRRAPHLAGPAHDVDPRQLHSLPSAAFWAAFEERYGLSPALRHPAMRAAVEPTLRADFRAAETYRVRWVRADLFL